MCAIREEGIMKDFMGGIDGTSMEWHLLEGVDNFGLSGLHMQLY